MRAARVPHAVVPAKARRPSHTPRPISRTLERVAFATTSIVVMGPPVRIAPGDDSDYLPPVHLRRQPLHRSRDVAPLREPASRKTERQIGALDAAFAKAHAGRRRIARAAGDQRRIGRREHVLVGVGRAVLERAHRQSVLDLRRSLFEIARIDRAHAHVGRQRVAMRRDREEDAVDRLRLLFHGVGADMLRRFRRRQRRKGEGEIDALLRAGMALDFSADRRRRHVEHACRRR